MDLNDPNNMQNYFDNQNFLENVATDFSNNNFINTSSNTPEFTSSPLPPQHPSSSQRARSSRKKVNTPTASSDLAKRSKNSEIWNHFDLKNVDGIDKAFCKHCPKNYNYDSYSGTSTMRRHYSSKHADIVNVPSENANLPSQDSCEYELCKWICHAEMPFSVASSPKLNALLQHFNPQWRGMSRNTSVNKLNKIFEEQKMILANFFLKFKGKIALTSDIWTSPSQMGYVCVTAHYINDNFILHKRIICFKPIPPPHDASTIAFYIINTCSEYMISDKIFSITFDNASTNTSAIRILVPALNPILDARFFHLRCACHILNLVVQDALKVISILIQNLRGIVLYIKSSPARKYDWKQLCMQMSKKPKTPPQDVCTRWNSTFKMLEFCLEYKDVMDTFYSTKIQVNHHIENVEWERAQICLQFLQTFYRATNLLSGSYYPTSHSILGVLLNCSSAFLKFGSINGFEIIINECLPKWNKYFRNIPSLYVIAAIMDPRVKQERVKKLLKRYHENMQYEFDIESYMNDVSNLLQEIFQLYNSKFSSSHLCMGSSSSSKTSISYREEYDDFLDLTDDTPSINNELSSYLFTPIIANMPNFAILEWWKAQRTQYPILSLMACDILTPPMSSVASESAFSLGERILDDKRLSMSDKNLEMAVCLKDWFDAEDRQQNNLKEDGSSSSEGDN